MLASDGFHDGLTNTQGKRRVKMENKYLYVVLDQQWGGAISFLSVKEKDKISYTSNQNRIDHNDNGRLIQADCHDGSLVTNIEHNPWPGIPHRQLMTPTQGGGVWSDPNYPELAQLLSEHKYTCITRLVDYWGVGPVGQKRDQPTNWHIQWTITLVETRLYLKAEFFHRYDTWQRLKSATIWHFGHKDWYTHTTCTSRWNVDRAFITDKNLWMVDKNKRQILLHPAENQSGNPRIISMWLIDGSTGDSAFTQLKPSSALALSTGVRFWPNAILQKDNRVTLKMVIDYSDAYVGNGDTVIINNDNKIEEEEKEEEKEEEEERIMKPRQMCFAPHRGDPLEWHLDRAKDLGITWMNVWARNIHVDWWQRVTNGVLERDMKLVVKIGNLGVSVLLDVINKTPHCTHFMLGNEPRLQSPNDARLIVDACRRVAEAVDRTRLTLIGPSWAGRESANLRQECLVLGLMQYVDYESVNLYSDNWLMHDPKVWPSEFNATRASDLEFWLTAVDKAKWAIIPFFIQNTVHSSISALALYDKDLKPTEIEPIYRKHYGIPKLEKKEGEEKMIKVLFTDKVREVPNDIVTQAMAAGDIEKTQVYIGGVGYVDQYTAPLMSYESFANKYPWEEPPDDNDTGDDDTNGDSTTPPDDIPGPPDPHSKPYYFYGSKAIATKEGWDTGISITTFRPTQVSIQFYRGKERAWGWNLATNGFENYTQNILGDLGAESGKDLTGVDIVVVRANAKIGIVAAMWALVNGQLVMVRSPFVDLKREDIELPQTGVVPAW
jgi:hypothetical protein